MEKNRLENYRTWAIVIFAVAFLIRLVYLLQIKSNPFFYHPIVDELWNYRWAQEILNDSFWGKEVFFRGPLYPYLLALFLKITGSHLFWVRIIQALISSGSAVLTFLLAREYFEDRIARLAGIFYAFCGILIFYEAMLLIPVVFIFLNLLGLLLLARNRDNPSKLTYFLIGLIFGFSAITRPNILIVLPFFAVWLIWRFRKKIESRAVVMLLVAFFVGIIVPIVPVTVRNYIIADDFIPISSQGGINLYLGNNQSSDGLTMIMPEMVLDARIPWDEFIPTTTEYAEKQAGDSLSPSEVSAFWTNKAKEFIFSHPGDFIGLTFKKLVYLFSGFENSDQTDIYEFRKYSTLLSVLIFNRGLKFPVGLLVPLGLVGMVIGWKRRRDLATLYIFFIAYIPTIILFLVTARHRLTLLPILMVFSASLLVGIGKSIKESRWIQALVPALAAIILAIILNINFFDLGYRNEAQIHFQLALTEAKQGHLVAAEREYREALRISPLAPAISQGLGTILNQMGRYDEAVTFLSKAATLDPDYAEAQSNLGLALMKLGRDDEAERHLRRASILDPKLVEPFINLAEISERNGDREMARQYYLRALETGQKTAVVYTKLGVLYGRAGDQATAYRQFEQALQADSSYSPAYLNWGNILMLNGDTVAAQTKYLQTIAVDSTVLEAYYNLAVLAIKQNDPSTARINIDRILEIDSTFQPAIKLKERVGN